MVPFEIFEHNLETTRQKIQSICQSVGRPSDSVQILPVTKRHPIDAIHYAIRAGLPAVGENRVQEAKQKKPLLDEDVRWELIGHLQTNKAKDAVSLFDRIQSVDSLKLIDHLNRHAEKIDKSLPILIQCNAGNDPNKFGFDPEEMETALEAALEANSLQVEGLMTIAPLSDNMDIAKLTFENLRSLRDRLADNFGVPLSELSMGMTKDLEIAIKAGSTQVRVGTALYGPRIQMPPD